MEKVSEDNSDFVIHDNFQEDEHDSDLEGKLYAEIYYSNELHEAAENFPNNFEYNGMKSIQEIKNACQSSIQNTSEPLLNNPPENVANSSTGIETICSSRNYQLHVESTNSGEQFSDQLNKRLDLEEQVTLKSKSHNTSNRYSNANINVNENSQERFDRNLNLSSTISKSLRNKSETIINEESFSPNSKNRQRLKKWNKGKKNKLVDVRDLNNTLTSPKSVKGVIERETNLFNTNKRKSMESAESPILTSNEVQLNPIYLSRKMSWNDPIHPRHPPLLSDGAMDLLFPKGWRAKKQNENMDKKMKRGKKKTINTTKEKDNVSFNDKRIQISPKRISEDKIIEISSSSSSKDNSDDSSLSIEISQVKKFKENIETEKQMPIWLDLCSDSDESILEVPIPLKLPPPLVELKDSDSDSSSSNSNGIYDLKSTNLKKKQKKAPISTSMWNNITESDEDIEVTLAEDFKASFKKYQQNNLQSSSFNKGTDNSMTENLILNCNEIQKGASNLEEIKKMGRASLSGVQEEAFESVNETRTEHIKSLKNNSGGVEPKPSSSKATGTFTESKSKSRKNQMKVKNQKTSKEKSDEEYFFQPLSNKLKAFYNNSWGGENFSIKEVTKNMSRDPKRWAILDEDWKPRLLRKQRYFLNKVKCTLCHQPGHLRADCPEPRKAPICHMCGLQGHYETRCPNKICLTCGKKQNVFRQTCESCEKLFCVLCNSQGHINNGCPDLWRQYHHTISETEHQLPKNSRKVMKPSNQIVCCNCTMRGHDYFECNKYRWSQHYPTPSHVTSYNTCNQLSYIDSVNCQVTNPIEDSDETSENLGRVIEPESFIERDNFEISASGNNNTQILFNKKCKSSGSSNQTHEERIVLSNVEGAKLEGLIAGRITLKFLSRLSNMLHLDICITLDDNSRVEMFVKFHILFSQRYVFQKILYHWLCLSDQDKRNIIFKELSLSKKQMIGTLKTKIDILDRVKGNVKHLYIFVKGKLNWLKNHATKSQDKAICKRKNKLQTSLRRLVILLYKHDCGVETGAVSNFRKILTDMEEKKTVSLNTYIWAFYYCNLIFAKYTPTDLETMVNNYLALNGDKTSTSLNCSILSDNEEYIDQANSNQQNVMQEFPNHNDILNEPVSSIPSLLQIPANFNFNFSSPAQDFIPITNELNLSTTLHHKQYPEKHGKKSNKSLKKLNPRNSLTKEALMQEATFLMTKALQINLPHVTKSAIRIGDLINENKLRRKHINHLKCLINQGKKIH